MAFFGNIELFFGISMYEIPRSFVRLLSIAFETSYRILMKFWYLLIIATIKLLLFEILKNIKNCLFEKHPKFYSLRRIFRSKFRTLLVIGKNIFYKNINVNFLEICTGIG